jgi:uncharacterized membrane protein YcaP (DUF421 family)
MEKLFDIDWQTMFVPQVSLLEMVVRGSIMYLAMFAFLRFFRRQTGAVGTADVLVIVLIADAAQNGMAGDYKSIPAGLVLVATILFWDFLIDYLQFNIPALENFLGGSKLLLVKDGKMLRKNMRREMVTSEELRSQLRQQGIEELSEVEKCYLESDGEFSVIKSEKDDNQIGNKGRDKLPGA